MKLDAKGLRAARKALSRMGDKPPYWLKKDRNGEIVENYAGIARIAVAAYLEATRSTGDYK